MKLNCHYLCTSECGANIPRLFVIVLGNFDKGNLTHELPKYGQFFKCPTSEENVFDCCYTMISGAHVMVHLIPAYRRKLKLCKPVYLDCTDWNVVHRGCDVLDQLM